MTTENPSSPAEFLRANLSRGLSLPAACVEWFMDLWETIQTLDDYADGDPVSRDRLDALIWRTFVGLPGNGWFAQNAGQMIPALAQMVLKWQASDTAERAGQADARSFVWRAGYYDLVLLAVLLTHGEEAARKAAHLVMHLYGERLDAYLAEFNQGGSNA